MKLFNMLPEGVKKEALRKKMASLQPPKNEKRGAGGLEDTFNFKTTGHIKIESIDEKGSVTGVLADKNNLVVDGADEIVLRAFSGDPDRMLYKNRKVKDATPILVHVLESKLGGSAIMAAGEILHAPSVLWSAVNDEKFNVEYSYYPTTVFIKEEASKEFGKKAFSVSNVAAADRYPLTSEVHSTYTNLFIGIGSGEAKAVALNDPRLVLSEAAAFTTTEARLETTTELAEVKINQKISRFYLDVEKSNLGAQIDVFVNGVLKETIETNDSELLAPETAHFEYIGLDPEVLTEVRLVHSGSGTGSLSPKMTLVGFSFDALSKDMNSLIAEFENFETVFNTAIVLNTTPMPPYTIQLPHFPVKANTAKFIYEGTNFTEVLTAEELAATTFFVDATHGLVHFNRALSGLLGTFEVTGELFDTELATTMVATTLNASKVALETSTDVAVAGTVNGLNKVYTTPNGSLQNGTLTLKKNGVLIPASGIESINLATGTITLVTAPTTGDSLTATYSYDKNIVANVSVNKYTLPYNVKPGTLSLKDQNGEALTENNDLYTFNDAEFMVDVIDPKVVYISLKANDSSNLIKVEAVYKSDELPGVSTGYKRAVIDKPKAANIYPWFELDKGNVRFVAEFPENSFNQNVTIREMGLFDGPRVDDKIKGFKNYPVKAFSLVRVGDTVKSVDTGIRITWTITLLNEDNQPFQGGNN